MIFYISRCTDLPSNYAASTGADSIGPLFASPGTPVTGPIGGISETSGVAIVIIDELATMEFIVRKDGLATSGSMDAIKEALTREFPTVFEFLFALEFVSHITIIIPLAPPTRAIVSNFQAHQGG